MSSNIVVVLLNYNSPDDTIECIKSLNKSTVRPFVVLVDNGSTEGGKVDPVELKILYPDIHVIMNENNLGFGGGNNIGIRWALKNLPAQYFYILNNDTVSDINSIKILEDYMEYNKNIDVCSPRIMVLDESDVIWYGGGHIDWAKAGGRSWFINQRFDGDHSERDVSLMTGCAMFMRRAVIDTLGGFDERFFMYCEDIDLSARIVESGYKMKYIPSSVLYHKAHSSIRSADSEYFVPEGIENPSLCFYLEHVIYGSLLNLTLHAHGFEKIMGMFWLLIRWTRWSTHYLINARFDAFKAMKVGFERYKSVING